MKLIIQVLHRQIVCEDLDRYDKSEDSRGQFTLGSCWMPSKSREEMDGLPVGSEDDKRQSTGFRLQLDLNRQK